MVVFMVVVVAMLVIVPVAVIVRHHDTRFVEDEHPSAVRAPEMLRGEGLVRRAEGADAPGQQQHAVRERPRETEVVRGQEDADAASALLVDCLENRLLRRCVHGRQRLVQQEHLGSLREGASQQHALALTTRERTERRRALAVEPNLPERARSDLALSGGDPTEGTWRRRALQRDIERGDRELGLRGAVLRDERHSTGAFYTPPGREEVEQREKERGLPGRVRPDDRDDLARPKVEVDVVEDDAPSALDGQTLDLQQWFCGQPLRPSAMRSTLPRIMPR